MRIAENILNEEIDSLFCNVPKDVRSDFMNKFGLTYNCALAAIKGSQIELLEQYDHFVIKCGLQSELIIQQADYIKMLSDKIEELRLIQKMI